MSLENARKQAGCKPLIDVIDSLGGGSEPMIIDLGNVTPDSGMNFEVNKEILSKLKESNNLSQFVIQYTSNSKTVLSTIISKYTSGSYQRVTFVDESGKVISGVALY